MLKDAEGRSNDPYIFQHLIGEEIAGVFQHEGAVVLVMKSGSGIAFSPKEGYWVVKTDFVSGLIYDHKIAIRKMLGQVRGIENMDEITKMLK